MEIKAFEVGPFTGNVSNQGIRLWGAVGKSDLDSICTGYVRWRKFEADVYSDSDFKKISISQFFDGAGIVDIEGLESSTRYLFQAGYSLGSLDVNEIVWPSDSDSCCSSKTSSLMESIENTSFILGSCRDHASEIDGLSDKTFKQIYKAIEDGVYPTPDMLLMTGDQIYTDISHGITTEGFDKYRDIYRKQFTEKYFSKVMKLMPVYLQMDDHEVKNDWGFSDFPEGDVKLQDAMRAYNAYQGSLCPIYNDASEFEHVSELSGRAEQYWYEFERHDSRYFVMDVRYDRVKEGADWKLRSRGRNKDQLQDLLKWIESADADRVHFIVTPVPMFPDVKKHAPLSFPFGPLNMLFLKGTYKELWTSNVSQRQEILGAIDASEAKFIFLSGDVHCSFTCSLKLSSGKQVHSVVSSAFNWMLPGVRKSHFNWNRLRGFSRLSNPYTHHNNKLVEMKNNYTHIQVRNLGVVEVTIYNGHSGSPVGDVIEL